MVGLVVGSVLLLSLIAFVVQQIYLDRAAEPASAEEAAEER